MKIAFISYSISGESFSSHPRGTFAYLHFLRQFGHEVRHYIRRDCHRPLRLLGDLRRWKPDVVLGQHAGAMVAVFFRRLGLLPCPVVHAWDDYYDEQSRLPRWVVRPLEKASVTGADFITSISRYNVHRAEMWGKPATFIPHGVEADQRAGTLTLGIPLLKMVYLGDQSLYKGMLHLMDAMRSVKADLFMVGAINPELQVNAPKNVHFLGKIHPQEVQSLLRQADVLVNPSDQDSNFKLQEYVRAARPILGVVGRMSWAFTHGVDAWLTDDLCTGIKTLCADAVLRERLAEGVRKRTVLTWEEAVRELESALLAVVAASNQVRP